MTATARLAEPSLATLAALATTDANGIITPISGTNPIPVSGSAAAGSAPTAPPLSVSGVDGGGLKRHLLTDPAGRLSVREDSVQGAVALTVGTPAAAGRQLLINCTVAGNISVTFADTSTLTIPVGVGLQILPWAVTQINTSGTTATATYANLS